MTKKIKRVFHHYSKMEEFHSVMWKQLPVADRASKINDSIALMIEFNAFEDLCMRVLELWPNSSEANLSASTINHQAWIGHAACCISHGSTEELTRIAWRTLTKEQQDNANRAAENAINFWRSNYAKA